jgi:hypothetical protein
VIGKENCKNFLFLSYIHKDSIDYRTCAALVGDDIYMGPHGARRCGIGLEAMARDRQWIACLPAPPQNAASGRE